MNTCKWHVNLGWTQKSSGSWTAITKEPWKLPLPQFIRRLYFKRFGRERPNAVRSIEEMIVPVQAKEQSKKAAHDRARSMVDQRDDPTQ
jgi:hypothetical protein